MEASVHAVDTIGDGAVILSKRTLIMLMTICTRMIFGKMAWFYVCVLSRIGSFYDYDVYYMQRCSKCRLLLRRAQCTAKTRARR